MVFNRTDDFFEHCYWVEMAKSGLLETSRVRMMLVRSCQNKAESFDAGARIDYPCVKLFINVLVRIDQEANLVRRTVRENP